MNLPKVEKPQKYVGLYVFDFGDQAAVGFTAEEVAELLESEKYGDGKVYKIHAARPDGTLELAGVPREKFELESGMVFYAADEDTAQADFKQLGDLAVTNAPPCRTKVHLVKYNGNRFATALIYPAEYDDEISGWLLDGRYKTSGAAEGGTGAIEQYYNDTPQLLDQHQLWPKEKYPSRTGAELLANLRKAVQR